MVIAKPKGGQLRAAERADPDLSVKPGEWRAFVLTACALGLFLYFVRAILLPFIVAGIVAYICSPLVDYLTKRTGKSRTLFAVIVFLLLLGGAGVFVAFAGQQIVAEVQGTMADLQQTIGRLIAQVTENQTFRLFGQSIDPGTIGPLLFDRIRDWLSQPDQLGLIAGYSLAMIVGLFLMATLLCYFLLGGPGIARGLLWVIPPRRRELVARIAARIDPLLKHYFIGLLVIMVYAMAAAYVGLGLVLGVNHALLLAILTGTLETVPIVGSTFAAVIAGLVSLHTATGLMSIVAFAVYAVLLRLSIDQIIGPLVLGSAAHLHPALIIFCFFAGASLLGIPGIILAVPAALAVKTTLATLYGDEAPGGTG